MKVLVAEDDHDHSLTLQVLLSTWGFEPILTKDGLKALEVLQGDDSPRLAILDWRMPGLDGIEVCREVRKQRGKPHTYLLLLTGRGQKQDVVEGLEAGADDYVVKPYDADELRARLHAGERLLQLQDRLLATQEQLRIQAMHDPHTGLWNRGAILDILWRELARTERESGRLGVIMADLDHFKNINDTYGHLAGDAVLREVVQRMRATMRPYDGIGRYGGEEFLIVLPNCDAEASRSISERLRQSVEERAITLPEGTVFVTMSLGVVLAADVTPADAEAVLRAADEALYRAKRNGRNRVEFAEEIMAEQRPLSEE